MMALTLSSTPCESDSLYPNDFAVALRVEARERPPRRSPSIKTQYIIAAGLAALAVLAGGVAYFAVRHEQSASVLTQSLSSARGNPNAASAGASGLVDGREALRDSLVKAFGLDSADDKLHALQEDLKDLQSSTAPAAAGGSGAARGDPPYARKEYSKKPL